MSKDMADDIKSGELELYHDVKQVLERSKSEVEHLLAALKLTEPSVLAAASTKLSQLHKQATMGSSDDHTAKQQAPTLLSQQEYYNELKAHLLSIKRERQRRLVALKSQERQLCYDVLGETTFEISNGNTTTHFSNLLQAFSTYPIAFCFNHLPTTNIYL